SLFLFNDPPPTYSYTLFPTRRSSDLNAVETRWVPSVAMMRAVMSPSELSGMFAPSCTVTGTSTLACAGTTTCCGSFTSGVLTGRSEEHTSELQSRRDLVCRLLLEKKK